MAGVNGKLYAQDITESDICSILPTGWYDTIQTVQLSGREIKQLCKMVTMLLVRAIPIHMY